MSETINNVSNPEEKKKGGSILIGIIAILVVMGIALAVVAGNKGTSNEGTAASTAPTEEASSIVMDSSTPMASATAATDSAQGEVTTIDVEAGSFYYKPAEMTIKKGEKVKIVLKSVDMMHDFNIEELGVKVPIAKSGETSTAEFTATKTGTFEYYCSVGTHREKGQVGKITVE
ncbi:MAG: cupredoxin domain-containing protein [bacterium]|nr:cupredoxin domain-containing protein [bacterium]